LSSEYLRNREDGHCQWWLRGIRVDICALLRVIRAARKRYCGVHGNNVRRRDVRSTTLSKNVLISLIRRDRPCECHACYFSYLSPPSETTTASCCRLLVHVFKAVVFSERWLRMCRLIPIVVFPLSRHFYTERSENNFNFGSK